MRRRHGFELLDQPWCPAFLREALTDYLQQALALANPYAPVVGRLASALQHSGARGIVDLCAGAGGPWEDVKPALDAALPAPTVVCLTDRFPPVHVNNDPAGVVRYPAPVDALQVPPEIQGFRTLFSGFHHFRPEQAEAILRDAVRQRQGIGVFEATERSLPCMLAMLATPLLVWALTPRMRPVRPIRLLFTYLIPLVPLGVLFDGMVSCWRTYTPEELRAMVDRIGAEDYVWQIGAEPIPGAPFPATYLIGYPAPSSPSTRSVSA